MKYFGDNSLAKLIALIKDTLSAHTDDASIHVTAAKKAAWDACEPLIISGDLVKTDLVSTGVSSTGSSVSAGSSQITNLDKTREKVKEAVQAGAPVTCRVNFETVIDLPLVMYYLTDSADIYVFSALAADAPCYAQLYYTDDESSGAFDIGSIPTLSDDTPSAPGTASAGTSEKAARADHVHPSELPKATLVTLSSASWDASAKTQTVDVAGIDADESKQVIYVTPYSADTQAYKDAGIQMSAQAAGKATFICESVPTRAVKVWVVVEDVYDVSPVKHSLKFSSPSAFSISVGTPGWDGTMKYSTDGTVWKTWTGTEISGALTDDKDDKYVLYVQGANNTKVAGNTSKAWVLTGGNITCDGNIETLLDYAAVAAGYHPRMANQCYSYMFYNCTNLISAPTLPATTLASCCYESMFRGCTSLTTAPALPATTLADNCYQEMFSSCVNLTAAPALPATTLANYCYGDMFRDCISLTTAPALPATALADECYIRMFRNCTGLTTPPALPATTLAAGCYGGVFEGCTSLTSAPDLPATTLAKDCYTYMFLGCTGLTSAPTLPATTLAYNCYYGMFKDCKNLVTAPTLSATTLDIQCYSLMFYNCTSLASAPALPATTLANMCYYSMFYGCTGLTTAPALPATTLTGSCYENMFYGCTKLKLSAAQTGSYTKAYRIPTSGAGVVATDALTNMFNTTGGTFTGTPEINTTYYLDASNTIV